MAASLDTLEIVKRLRQAGFDEPQAEALTGVVRDLRESERSELATKTDIGRLEAKLATEIGRLETKFATDNERLEAKLVTEIGRLEARMDVRFAELKTDVIRWVFGIVFAQGALILGVLRLFPGGHP